MNLTKIVLLAIGYLLGFQEVFSQEFSGVYTYRFDARFDKDTSRITRRFCELTVYQNQSEYRTVDMTQLGSQDTENSKSILAAKSSTHGIFKDFTRGKIVSRESAYTETFCVEDSLIPIAWKTTNEKRKIGEWQCEKAEAQVRGRAYEVWFAPDIPLEDGPWKLYGLPGLILEAESKDGRITILLQKYEPLTTPFNKRPVCQFGSTYSITSKELGKRLEKNINNYIKMKNSEPLDKGVTSRNIQIAYTNIEVFPFQQEKNNEK
ncbi:MAG: GLPGLI family protein [Siphonobacter sp.]